MAKHRKETYRKVARKIYENEDLKIDVVAEPDVSKTGAWVIAWVWVADEDVAHEKRKEKHA